MVNEPMKPNAIICIISVVVSVALVSVAQLLLTLNKVYISASSISMLTYHPNHIFFDTLNLFRVISCLLAKFSRRHSATFTWTTVWKPVEKKTMENITESFDYDYSETAVLDKLQTESQEMNNLMYMYTGMYGITVLLGVPLNILVIITLFRRIENYEAAIWLFGMAISDLIFCLFLPFHIFSAWDNFTWRFGLILCKLNSFVPFMSMYLTAFIISFMSLEQLFFNKFSCTSCRFNASKNMLLISWFAAAILSCPSLLFRVVQHRKNGEVCMDNYEYGTTGLVTTEGLKRKSTVLYMRFIFGSIFPAASAAICCCLLVLRKNSFQLKSSMKYRIRKALVIAHCLCWLPCLFLPLWQFHSTTDISDIFAIIVPVSNALAAMSGCIKPIIYIIISDSLCLPWMKDDYATTGTELTEIGDKNDP